jgi:hypothetical protein
MSAPRVQQWGYQKATGIRLECVNQHAHVKSTPLDNVEKFMTAAGVGGVSLE